MMPQDHHIKPLGYRIVRQIGEGGMAQIYEACDQRLNRKVAIKILHSFTADHTDLKERFLQEACSLQHISHPGIVKIFDYGLCENSAPYLIMEFLEGEALAEVLRKKSRLPPRVSLEIGRQIASTLAAIHANGIIHRDLKPSNLMLVRNRDEGRQVQIKMLDFGIARLRGMEDTPCVRQNLGTLDYLAPEYRRTNQGDRATDESASTEYPSDQWALASILYQLISGSSVLPQARLPSGFVRMPTMDEPSPWDQFPRPVAANLTLLLDRMTAHSAQLCPTMQEVEEKLQRLRDDPLWVEGGAFRKVLHAWGAPARKKQVEDSLVPSLLPTQTPVSSDEGSPTTALPTISCDQAEEFVSRALDSDLMADESKMLQAHLHSCPTCSTTADQMSAAVQRLRRFGQAVRPPVSLYSRIAERLERARLLTTAVGTDSVFYVRKQRDKPALH